MDLQPNVWCSTQSESVLQKDFRAVVQCVFPRRVVQGGHRSGHDRFVGMIAEGHYARFLAALPFLECLTCALDVNIGLVRLVDQFLDVLLLAFGERIAISCWRGALLLAAPPDNVTNKSSYENDSNDAREDFPAVALLDNLFVFTVETNHLSVMLDWDHDEMMATYL